MPTAAHVAQRSCWEQGSPSTALLHLCNASSRHRWGIHCSHKAQSLYGGCWLSHRSLALTCTKNLDAGCPLAQGCPGPLLCPPHRLVGPVCRTVQGRQALCSAGGQEESASSQMLSSWLVVLKSEGPTRLPRRLLLRLPPAPARLWHSASKPRMPPTQSPSSTTCRQHKNHPSGSQCPARIQGKASPNTPTPLTWPQKPVPSAECRKAA